MARYSLGATVFGLLAEHPWYDKRGSVLGYSDKDGNCATVYNQDVFGNVISCIYSGEWASVFGSPHLMGQDYDSDADCYVTDAGSPYIPQTGRFASSSFDQPPYDYIGNPVPPDTDSCYNQVADDAICPPGQKEIWKCKRPKEGAPGYIGPILRHDYICCNQPDANGKAEGCYAHFPHAKTPGKDMPKEPVFGGRCAKYCVPEERREGCCENPTVPKPYHPVFYDCQTYARHCTLTCGSVPSDRNRNRTH